jgi:hypothetical protein
MERAASAPVPRPAGRLATAVVLTALVVAGLMLAAAGMLWMRYGTDVFFQTLASGLAACF